MNKLFYIRQSVLSLSSLLTISFSSPALAEAFPIIVVTPSSVEQARELSSTPVTVIDSAAIENSNASNLAELLRGQAGLHISDLFGDGSHSSVDLRGFGSSAGSNTLILVDGRRLNNSSDTAAPDLSTIDIDNIKQIEIMQGSAGVLYGHQAVGGVINIISHKVTQDKASLKLDVGSYQSYKLSASLQKHIGQTQLSFSASDQSSDNYRDHNDSDKQHLALNLVRQHRTFSAYVELQTTDEQIQTPGALLKTELDEDRLQSLHVYSADYFDTQSDLIRIGIDKPLNAESSLNIDFNKRINDREFIQSFRNSAGTLSTQDRDTGTLSTKYTLQPLSGSLSTLIAGVNLEQTDYELVSSVGPQSTDQTINDVYVSTEWALSERGQFQIGVRVSEQSADISSTVFGFNTALEEDETITVGSIGYTWHASDWKLYARADQNFRYPTVEESTNVSFSQSFPMQPQEGVSIEIGAEYIVAQSHYRATLYSIELDNEIAFDSSGFSNLNLDSTQRHGVILEASRDWSDELSSSISFTYLDAEITDGAFEGNTLPQVPETTIRFDSAFQINQQMLISVELIAVSKQVFGGDFANQLDKIPAYQVVNTHLSYDVDDWDFSFRINNLLDEKYSERGSQYSDFSNFPSVTVYESFFPAPERNFWLSAKYTF